MQGLPPSHLFLLCLLWTKRVSEQAQLEIQIHTDLQRTQAVEVRAYTLNRDGLKLLESLPSSTDGPLEDMAIVGKT